MNSGATNYYRIISETREYFYIVSDVMGSRFYLDNINYYLCRNSNDLSTCSILFTECCIILITCSLVYILVYMHLVSVLM